MDKLDLKSMDKVQGNIEWIREKFPNVVTEIIKDGKTQLAVDFDALKEELSSVVMNEKQERYQFTWPDKGKAKMLAAQRITSTLRPCVEESVNFDTTKNLYIEGDNLDVLKLLQETYLGKIKMIYIDPPYNTGNDFVYEDDFDISSDDYKDLSGDYDEQGNRLVKNLDSNGRFHTDWLNMIYPRLKVAKDLLTDDGVIFISIDDNEVTNLKKICDEIFGSKNYLLTICVNKASEIAANFTIAKHEYLLVYLKDINKFTLDSIVKYSVSRGTVGNENQTMPIIEFPAGLKCKNISDGIYADTRKIPNGKENIENLDPIVVEQGRLKYPARLKARWRSSNDMRNFFANNCMPTRAKINGDVVEIYFENDKFNPQIRKKTYEKLPSLYLENKKGSDDLKKLGLERFFDYPKNMSFIKHFLSIITDKDSIILDFFSGSATTAHAVMQLNAEDGGYRKFIMVQLPEPCEENSEAYKAGYKNICEIGKERIRRAGNKIVGGVRARCLILALGFLSLIAAICRTCIIIPPLCRSRFLILL